MKIEFFRFKFFLLVVVLLLLPSCSWLGKKENALQKCDLKVICVNDKNIYADAHIKGDINITFDDLDNLANIVSAWPKSTRVVFYCTDYRCVASEYFAKSLVDLGFEKVYTYKGGIVEWYQLGCKNNRYKIEGPCEESYLTTLVEPIISDDDLNKGFTVITAELLLRMIEDCDSREK